MSLPKQPETAQESISNRKKLALSEARADALRANLKKRKNQTNARKDETIKE